MIMAPVLAYPKSHDTFILDTNTSNVAVGAELSQVQDGVERTIALLACATEITSQTDRILLNTPRTDDVAVTNITGCELSMIAGFPVVIRIIPLVVRCVDISLSVDEDRASWTDVKSKTQMRKEQLEDTDIKPVFTWLEPSPNELYNHGIATKHLWGNKERLRIYYTMVFCTMSGLLTEAPVGA